MANLHEECGVFGVYSPKPGPVADLAYYGLYALQHRGQESCGIVVNDDGVFASRKDIGLVNEVFSRDDLMKFPQGRMAVAHARYGTTGGNSRANCQPIEVNHQKGKMALAHNGNLSNAYELRSELELGGAIFHTTSDTEIIAYIVTQARLNSPSIENALSSAMNRLEGAYSLVLMSAAKLLAARDPYGFRPLCYGKTLDGTYVVASESCALSAVDAEFIRDVLPGEIVTITNEGIKSDTSLCQEKHAHCIFEYIYFARLDSHLDGISTYEARIRGGAALAAAYPVEADIVVGVPDSGLAAAKGYSEASGIPFALAFHKNSYVGRTFIKPTQKERESAVRVKLNVIEPVVRGKRIVLVDDSIVRGTTIANLIHMLKKAGALSVHVRVASPPFLHPCYFGTDVPSNDQLIACSHNLEEIRDSIGADSLGYMKIEDLPSMVGDLPLCCACFDGNYPMNIQ